MPYKRKNSPFYQIEIVLPAYGGTSQISSGVTDKTLARRMESMLRDLAQKAIIDPTLYKLLDAICVTKEISLPQAMQAHTTGALGVLSRNLTNPTISHAIEELKLSSKYDKPTWAGLEKLDALMGSKRLSALSAKRITELCFEVEREGVERNTVCRQFKRACSKLLRHHLGSSERNTIFADVTYAAVDDTRKVHLSPDDLARLFDTCERLGYHELAVLVRLALQTSADRGVLLSGKAGNQSKKECRGLLKRDVQIFMDNATGELEGIVTLNDGKTESRDRSVPITDYLCREVMALTKDKSPDDPVFNMRYMDLDFPWKRVRKDAGFYDPDETGKKRYTLRFKDLRAQSSQYGAIAGIPQQVLSSTYGHSGERMIRRYQKYDAAMTGEQAKKLEAAMFGKTGS